MKIWRFLTLNRTHKPFMTFSKKVPIKVLLCLLETVNPLSVPDSQFLFSFSSTHTHTHTHIYIYIFIYTHTQSRLLCWVGWVVESLWGGLSALIGFWSTPLSFSLALSHCATACLSLPTHSIHSVCVCVFICMCVCVCWKRHIQLSICFECEWATAAAAAALNVRILFCDVCHRGSVC